MTWLEEQLSVSAGEAGERLDKWLAESLQELDYEVSRSQVQDWVQQGYVKGPRKKVKASDRIAGGDRYEVTVPELEPIDIAGDDIPVEIVFQDDDIVVVNKPRGLVVHPAAGHARGTLVNALVGLGVRLAPQGGAERPGVVHRIDKDTSGLLVLAKSEVAYRKLADELKQHKVQRLYRAIAHGRIGHDAGVIEAPVGRDTQNRQRMAVVANGKEAVTRFRVLERFSDYSYLELSLETGRTHQIRVHMSYIGHPLAGDPLYGRRNTLHISGQALHAMTLGFTHPRTGESLRFEAPLPPDMAGLLDELRATVDA